MNKKQELLIKLNEQLKIYKDSPGVTVTYIDLARTIENIIFIIDNSTEIGFK